MDKKTFLEELKRSLSVLQEAELNDIMDEYEQHIDMKVQSGLTEEEAIADFGNLKELTAEILEAYHVRADYAASRTGAAGENRKAGRLEGIQARSAAFGESVNRKRKALWEWIVGLLKLDIPKGERHGGSFFKEDAFDMEADNSSGMLVRSVRRMTAYISRVWRRLWQLTGRSIRFCLLLIFRCVEKSVALIRWCAAHAWQLFGICVRICWNIFWGSLALFCGFMGLFCLFGFGILLVLLLQGYPLAGVTIGVLGLNLCLFAAAGLGVTFLWRKRAAAAAEEVKLIEKEEKQHA